MKQLELKLIAIRELAFHVKYFTLIATDDSKLPNFSGGAHLKISLPGGDDRSYSLIRFTQEESLHAAVAKYFIAVKLEEAGQGGSNYMHSLRVGAVVRAWIPENDFPLISMDTQTQPTSKTILSKTILIAGGIGITPIISMATELKNATMPYHLYYSGRKQSDLIFREELCIQHQDSISIYAGDLGQKLDLENILDANELSTHIYVCGPKRMIEAVREKALEKGFAKENVHFELFTNPTATSGDKAFEVELKSTGQVFVIPIGKTIIDVLEEAGIDLLYDCQRGDCGICKTDLVEGVADHRDVILSNDEKLANNVIQICVSRAKSAKLVLDL